MSNNAESDDYSKNYYSILVGLLDRLDSTTLTSVILRLPEAGRNDVPLRPVSERVASLIAFARGTAGPGLRAVAQALVDVVPKLALQLGLPLTNIRDAYLEYLIEWHASDAPSGINYTEGKISTLPLKQVFIALDVERLQEVSSDNRQFTKEIIADDEPPFPARERASVKERIDLPRVLREHPRLVLLGAPGAGKSTITKHLSAKMADAILSGAETTRDEDNNDYGRAMLPIQFRISEFADALSDQPNLSLREFLPHAFDNCSCTPNELQTLLFKAIDSGEAFVIMDGLDEITAGGLRSKVANEIQEFIAGLHGQTRVLITSRIAGYREGAQFGSNISAFTLCEMDRAQIGQFLKKRCLAYEEMLNRIAPAHGKLLVKIVRKNADEERAAILRAVDEPTNTGVRLLAGVPLLLTILALIHRNGKHLPNRRIDLYELAVNTLLREWRVGQGIDKKFTVSPAEALCLMGPLATHLHETTSTGLIKKEALRQFLCNVRANLYEIEANHPENEAGVDDFLQRVEKHTGLLVEIGKDEYGFLHLTFEEYFAARDLLLDDNNPRQFIYAKRHMSRWVEPIRLAISYKRKQDPIPAARWIREVILGRGEDFSPSWGEELLHRDLILAAYCLADCEEPPRPLVREISGQLLNLVGNADHHPAGVLAEEVLVPFAIHDLDYIISVLIERLKIPEGDGAHLIPDGYAARVAARLLGKLGVVRNDVLQVLIERVRKPSEFLCDASAAALGNLGCVQEDVIQALTQRELSARSVYPSDGSAAIALGKLGAASEELINTLTARVLEVAGPDSATAAVALRQMGTVRPSLIQILLERLQGRDEIASGFAARTLWYLGITQDDVIQALVKIVQGADGFASDSAALALVKLGHMGEELIPILVKRAQNPDGYMPGNAAAVLGMAGFVRDDVIQALINFSPSQVKSYQRASAIEALGQLGVPRDDVMQALINFTQENDMDSRRYAAIALGQLGCIRDDILQSLVQLTREEHEYVRGPAISALFKLVEKATNDKIPLPPLD